MTKKLESFVFKGQITATSNKQSDDFVNENPRKTAYIKVDDINKKILLENGLTEYTSKDDSEDFFIIKLSESVKMWIGEEGQEVNCDINTSNFETQEIGIACIKGFSKGNSFVRIYAFNLKELSDIAMVEQKNPFA